MPFYLWERIEGDRENDRFGDQIACGDIDGDGHDEWVISSSTATLVRDEGGVNPLFYHHCGKVHILSCERQVLFTLEGSQDGGCFGASLTLCDVDGDGVQEIIVGAPRANSLEYTQCGTISIFSGRTAELLYSWSGTGNYARLGCAVTVLDWDGDGLPEVAASSHLSGPNGEDLAGRVTIFSVPSGRAVEQWTGVERETLGLSLASGDVDGDGEQEIIVGAPGSSNSGLTRNGRVLVYAKDRGLVHESSGKRSFDEYGQSLAVGDLDGDGADDVLIGAPRASGISHSLIDGSPDGVFTQCGMACVLSIAQGRSLLEKEGWFPGQGLGMSIRPYIDLVKGTRHVLTGSRAGAAYIVDLHGHVVHEFNGCEPEVFSHSVACGGGEGGLWIAVGAVAGFNQKKFMSGCVYVMSPSPPAPSGRQPLQSTDREKDSCSRGAPPPPSTSGLFRQGRMKILLCTYWYLPHVGGVDVYVRLLKEELERLGHHVDVLAHHPDMAHYYLAGGDKQIDKWRIKRVVYDKVFQFYQRYLAQVEPWIRYRDIERYCFEVAAAMFGLEQYDLIHTQDIVSTRALSRVKPSSVPLVATIHGLLAKEHLIAGDIVRQESLGWKYVSDEEFYGCTSADVTIVPTQWLRAEMEKFAVPPESLRVIPYGMDIGQFEKRGHLPMSRPAQKKGEFTICCPARLVPVKGHRTLLHALRRLSGDSSWHCWFAGDGPLRVDLQKTIEILGLADRVTLLGDRDDMPAVLRQADLMVLPSVQDNLPFSIMEAQIAGTPVVASRAGGIPEMIQHEHTGLLFDVGDEVQLAACIDRMIHDRLLRAQLGAAGRAWARAEWSAAALMERTLAAYEMAHAKARR